MATHLTPLVILLHTFSGKVLCCFYLGGCHHGRNHISQPCRSSVSFGSSKLPPFVCFHIIFWDTSAKSIHRTEVFLGNGISLFGSKCVPLHGSLIVLGNSNSLVVHPTQTELGTDISLFGSTGVPRRRCLVVSRNTLSLRVHHTHIVQGNCMSLFCKRSELFQSRREISPTIGIQPLLKISRERSVPHQQG